MSESEDLSLDAPQDSESEAVTRRRAILKAASWAVPVILAVSLPKDAFASYGTPHDERTCRDPSHEHERERREREREKYERDEREKRERGDREKREREDREKRERDDREKRDRDDREKRERDEREKRERERKRR